MVEPGVTTRQINREVHKFITKSGASPCFMTDGGFPTAACISVNDEIIHGIPGDRVLHEGDIVSVDVGARYRGFNGDCAGTFPCGKCSDEALRLIRITRQSFFEGIQFARVGYRISDIGHAVQEYAESYGYSLVREYVGHGVGAGLHEAPEIPNYGKPGHGPRLQKNMTIAVEPMVNVGGYEVRVLDENGNPAAYAQLPVHFAVEGDAALVGPETAVAEGGMTGTYLRTAGKAGTAVLTVSAPQTEPVTVSFTLEKEEPVWN